MSNDIKETDLYHAFRQAMIDALAVVRNLEANNKYISTHIDFTEISYFKSGLPHITKNLGLLGGNPKDYSSIFGGLLNHEFKSYKPKSWDIFCELAISDKHINDFYSIEEFGHFGKYQVEDILNQLLDYYINTTGLKYYKWKYFLPIFIEWLNAMQDKLQLEYIIPISFLNFESKNNYNMHNSCAIEKIDENIQLARCISKSYTVSSHEIVIGAATHAYVLKNWTIDNKTKFSRDRALNNIETHHKAIEQIEHFFSSIRVITGYEVGYAQIVCKPVSWCDNWKANLKIPYTIDVRKYPEHFENFGWLKTPDIINNNELQEISEIYQVLSTNKTNKLKIASKRLNSASLRTEDDDAFLDVMIALESLLVEDSKTESTHKLAMRLAALNSVEQYNGYSTEEIFKASKKLSEHRGKLVHGSHKISQSKEIKINKRKAIPALNLGIGLLRHSILVCCKHPELLEKEALDKYIFDTLDMQK